MKKTLLFLPLLAASLAFAQEKKVITGTVTDDQTLVGIAGASVKVEAQSISTKTDQKGIIESITVGTVTDDNGNFSLEVPANTEAVLISYLGYESRLIQLSSGNGNYTISLKTTEEVLKEDNALQEVVVTGYQKIEKRKLTSAIGSVKMDDIQQAGVASVDQLLAGQIAGVAVTPETGSPGGATKIRIRGTASLSGPQDPLW